MTPSRTYNRFLFVVLSVLMTAVTADESDSAAITTVQPYSDTSHSSVAEDDAAQVIKDQEKLIEQCHDYAQALMTEKERLRSELDAIKARMEAVALQDMEEEANDSNESHSRSRGIRRSGRGRRGTASCEGGTVSQWACGSQCIFKLKGLCGLSLRAMCHC